MNAPVNNKNNKKAMDIVKSAAWLIEAVFRGFVGYMLAVHFRHDYIALAASAYALVTAGMIVVAHFVKAHKS